MSLRGEPLVGCEDSKIQPALVADFPALAISSALTSMMQEVASGYPGLIRCKRAAAQTDTGDGSVREAALVDLESSDVE